MALNLIRDSARAAVIEGANWKQLPGSLVNPATTMFLLDEIDRLRDLLRVFGSPANDYSKGYKDGWSDCAVDAGSDEKPLSWAIVNRTTEEVSFDVKKPNELARDEVAIALFAKGDAQK